MSVLNVSRFGLVGLLVVAGAGSIGFDVLLGHPNVRRFATQGRLVIGRVSYTPHDDDTHPGERPSSNRSLIVLDDPELGPQVVDIYGALPSGQSAQALCLTSAGRCESADVVRERLSLWPLTPLVLSGAAELAIAATLLFARYRERHRRRLSPERGLHHQ